MNDPDGSESRIRLAEVGGGFLTRLRLEPLERRYGSRPVLAAFGLVGVTSGLMVGLRTPHPPAGATTLIVSLGLPLPEHEERPM